MVRDCDLGLLILCCGDSNLFKLSLLAGLYAL